MGRNVPWDNFEAIEEEILVSGKQGLKITASLDMKNRPVYLDSLYIIDKPYMYEITIIYSRNNEDAINIAKDIIQSIKLK